VERRIRLGWPAENPSGLASREDRGSRAPLAAEFDRLGRRALGFGVILLTQGRSRGLQWEAFSKAGKQVISWTARVGGMRTRGPFGIHRRPSSGQVDEGGLSRRGHRRAEDGGAEFPGQGRRSTPRAHGPQGSMPRRRELISWRSYASDLADTLLRKANHSGISSPARAKDLAGN